MNNNQSEENIFTFPDEQEIKAAQAICCGRYCSACEAPAEYAWRKRDVDMSLLLEEAIENELSDIEKKLVTYYWFDSLTVSEISLAEDISTSAVSTTLKRALGKLEKALGYAVKYQRDLDNETVIPLVLGKAAAIIAARRVSDGGICDRVHNLRMSQNLSREKLGKAIGIPATRLKTIESGLADAEVFEIITLSEFFNVTTDYILKGENNEKEITL